MQALLDYTLHLADNALVLGQRNAEWTGHGPILEEDIAMSNITLDLIGQARLLYQYAAQLKGGDTTEDTLAYLRDANEFRNYTLLELPHYSPQVGNAEGDAKGDAKGGAKDDSESELDYATTIVRNFLYSALMTLLWQALQKSTDTILAEIAEKSVKEARYHLQHSSDWLVKLGDGTDESHQRTQAALDHLMPYTQEFWMESKMERAAIEQGIGVNVVSIRADWDTTVDNALSEATLRRPPAAGKVTEGKLGNHSEHLEHLLAEMQSLARTLPHVEW
jgi:ring-1,2-phenylacetyl-CoA epoxidase subunit PaaC